MFAQANELVAVADGIVELGLLVSIAILVAVLVDEWTAGRAFRRQDELYSSFAISTEKTAPQLTLIRGGRSGDPRARPPRKKRRDSTGRLVPSGGTGALAPNWLRASGALGCGSNLRPPALF